MLETLQRDAEVERLSQYDAFPLPLRHIYYDADFNCRGWFTLQSVSDLAENIRLRGRGVELKGLDCPVVVQPIADMAGQQPAGFDYRLIAGHRRFKAIEVFLKWTRIPAMIRAGLSDHEARMLNFVENLERKDLNILEEARGLQHLYPDGVTVRAAATELKRPTAWVHDRLRLLTLPEEVQQLAATGLLGAVNIKVLIALATPEEQIAAARKIVEAKRECGKTASLHHLDPKYRRKFGYRKSKAAINQMVYKMLGCGITGLGPRMGAWCAGYVSDAEIEKDIEEAALTLAGNADLTGDNSYGDGGGTSA
jgi:ParB/RepB/Spo0J family partition protein